MPNTDELRPCPACGSRQVGHIIVGIDDRAVACDECCHRGPTRRSRKAAANGWNKEAERVA